MLALIFRFPTNAGPASQTKPTTNIPSMKKFLLIAAILTGASVASNAQDVISWAYANGNPIPATGTELGCPFRLDQWASPSKRSLVI